MNNFLSLVWYKVLPPVYGGQKGIAHFNEYLGRKVKLTCLCSENNQPTEQLSYTIKNELPVSKWQFWNPFVRQKILSLLKTQSYTHVIIEHPYYGWVGKFKEQLNYKFVVHAHNIEHLRMRIRGKVFWRNVKSMEAQAFELADLILFKTDDDLNEAVTIFNCNRRKCMVVPFGISQTSAPIVPPQKKAAFRQRMGAAETETILLFAASFDYEPNLAALEIISKEIIPRLRSYIDNFRIIICGNISPRQKKEIITPREMIFTGEVNDIAEYYQAADLFINPVVSGSGVQTKNLEALANGLPIVVTSFSSKGLPSYLIEKGMSVVPNHDPDAFARAIAGSLPGFSEIPTEFYEEYNWSNIIERFLNHPQVKG